MSVRRIYAWLSSDDAESVVKPKHVRFESRAAALFSVLVAVFALLICTRSSPLYPLNDWVDANCFFTVGKSMFNGRVLYRDIYEQKGILLYVIHGIGYLISNTTFIGVFIFETALFSAFLFIAYKTARLYAGYALSLGVLPVIAYSVLTSVSLRQGDSAEQLCLPFIALPIYLFLKSVKQGDGRGVPGVRYVFLLGMSAACVLWIKYTLLGVYIGYVLLVCVFCLYDKKYMRLFKCALAFVAGAAVISIPIFVYFAVNNAIPDLFEAYFYNNMFLYTDKRTLTDKLSGIASLAVRGLSYNGLWGIMAYVGFFSLVLDIKHPRSAAGAVFMYIGNVFFIYWGGIGWYYYSLGMAALSVPGFAFFARASYFVWQKCRELCVRVFGAVSLKSASFRHKFAKIKAIFDRTTRRAIAYVMAAALALSLGTFYTYRCYNDSPNVFYMKQSREDIWQEKFANIIAQSDEQTLLNYSCLDLGVYTTANILPSEKYFVRLNLEFEEITESLDSAISEQRVKFVVYRGYPSSFVRQYYKIVASEKSHVEYEGSMTTYYLLERID